MDSIIAQAGDKILSSLGAIGAIGAVLAAVITVLYRQNQALHAARLEDAKERAKDMKETSKIIEQNSIETRLSAEVLKQVLAALQQSSGNWQVVISEVRSAMADLIRDRRRERP